MQNIKQILIKHKNGKAIQKTTELSFDNMMGKDDWEIVGEKKIKAKPKPKPKPKPKAKKAPAKKKATSKKRTSRKKKEE